MPSGDGCDAGMALPVRAPDGCTGGRRPEGDIYRDAETPRAGLILSHMLIGYLRRIFLDVTVHATPMPSGRARNFRPINIDTYVTGLDTARLTQGHTPKERDAVMRENKFDDIA